MYQINMINCNTIYVKFYFRWMKIFLVHVFRYINPIVLVSSMTFKENFYQKEVEQKKTHKI